MYKLYLRGKTYHVYYNGKRFSTGKRDYNSALEFANNLGKDKIDWERFQGIITDYLENNGYDKQTIYQYHRVINHMEKVFTKEPLLLDNADFELYKSVRRKEVCNVTINTDLKTIQSMFNIMWKLGYRKDRMNIQKVFQPKTMPISISETEMNSIIENLDPVFKEYVIFAVNTGVRLRELTHLTNDNIEGDVLTIKTTATFKTKCDKYRRIPLNDAAKKVLSTVLNERLDAYWLSKKFKRTCVKLGLNPKYNFHTLRKTFATRLAPKVSLFELMSVMGHSDPKTSMIYIQPDLNNVSKAVNQI